MRREVQTVASWDFDKYIPCHGVRCPSLSSSVHRAYGTIAIAERHRKQREGGVEGGLPVVSVTIDE